VAAAVLFWGSSARPSSAHVHRRRRDAFDAFHYTTYFFGVFLIVTGPDRASAGGPHRSRAHLRRLPRRFLPMTVGYSGDRLIVREAGDAGDADARRTVLVATFDVASPSTRSRRSSP
jgi:hypothetical protein